MTPFSLKRIILRSYPYLNVFYLLKCNVKIPEKMSRNANKEGIEDCPSKLIKTEGGMK